jgi:hypothetical protein
MPQTFKDAIQIARGLNIRFLWIDGLCIVQPSASGDYTDWNMEGPRMGMIYNNAVCTIAATCADDVTEGFLSKLGSERICAVPCEVDQREGRETTLSCFLVPRQIHFGNAVTVSTLNRRGWVTQERLLSRRILHFTLQGIIWECHQARTHGKSAVLGVSDYKPVLSQLRSPSRGKNDLNTNDWFEFVSQYSATEFTNAEGRLIALSSLARVLHHRIGYKDVYCAGIWKNRLVVNLLWFCRDPPHAQSAKRLATVPTWSWASSSGPVAYCRFWEGDDSSPLAEAMPSVQVLDVHMILAQASNPYGNVKKGKIKLLAQVLVVPLWTVNIFVRELETKANKACPAVSRSVHWDESQDHLGGINEYLIIPMCSLPFSTFAYSTPQYAALIVEPVSSADITEEDKEICAYRRIGLLVDKPALEFAQISKTGRYRYNFGQSEKSPETLVLV